MKLASAAWVPDNDPTRSWNIAAGWAADWVDARCNELGPRGVLVTNTLDHLGVPALERFAQRHARVSRLSKSPVTHGVPVLSYVPEAENLHHAMTIARNSSIAVVEGGLFPLNGWAAWMEATDLTTNQPTPPLSGGIREVVERLQSNGNNNFGDPFGKQQAHSILNNVTLDDETADLILGAVLAAGVRPTGVKNLRRLIEAR